MPKTRHVVLALSALGLGAAITLALLLPSWVAGKAETALAGLEDQLGVDIDLAGIDVGILASFPRATITITDLRVGNRAPFAGVELFRAGTLEVKVDLGSLLSEAPRIRGLRLADAAVDLRSEGEAANWSLGDAEVSEAPPTPWSLSLDQVELDRVDLRYADASGLFAHVLGVSGRAAGDLADDRIALVAEATARVAAGDGVSAPWLADTPVTLRGPVETISATSALSTRGLDLRLGALPLRLRGGFVPAGDGVDVDVQVEAPDATFASVFALLPAGSAPGVEADGVFTLDARIKGHSGGDVLPGGVVDLAVRDASIARGSDRIDALAFTLHAERPDGPWEQTTVAISEARMSVLDNPLTLSARLAPPLTDPRVDLTAKGRVDVGALDRATGSGLGATGILDLDLSYAGRASSPSPEKARGQVRGKGLAMPVDGYPDPVQVDALDVGFADDAVTLRQLEARTGPSDVAVTGTLTRVMGYGLGTAPLGGRVAVRSVRLDLRTEEAATTDSDDAALAAVPTDLDLDVDLNLGRVLYGDYDLQDLTGGVGVHGGVLSLDGLSFRTLGGRMDVDGTYTAPTDQAADVDLTVVMDGLAMDQLMKTMDTARAAIPAAADAGGRVGGTTKVKTRLLADSSPDLPTLFSEGLVLTVGSDLAPDVLQALADKVGDPKIARLNLDGARFDYTIEKGRLSFRPVPVKLGSLPATLNGSAGVIDQTLDLGLTFPVSTAGLKAAGLAIPKGASKVDVTAKIIGPYAKPKLAVAVGGAEKIVEAVKEQVVDVVKDEAGKWIAEAEAQGDKLIAEAEKAAALVRSEAKKAAALVRSEAKKASAKLVSEAKGNPIAEAAAKKAGDALVAKADKEADKLESEAGKKADGLVAAAKKQKDQLVADARKRTR